MTLQQLKKERPGTHVVECPLVSEGMINPHGDPEPRRSGNVIVLVALVLIVLVGMAGFAIDGGVALTQLRTARATADAAAMAAAGVLYQNAQSVNASTLSTYQLLAQRAALDLAASNGFRNDAGTGHVVGTSKVTVNFPPNITHESIYNSAAASPSYDMALSDGVVEVVIDYYQTTYFTKVWGFDVIPISSRAVARGNWVSPKIGLLILDYTAGSAITDRGGGNSGGITVTGGGLVVNSNASNAVVDTGGAVITAPEFDITGGTSAPADGLVTQPTPNQIFTGIHPTPDPFHYLQPYAATTYNNLPVRSSSSVSGRGTATDPYVLEAGYRYTSIPKLTGNSDFIQITGTGMIGFDTDIDATGCTISGQGVCIYMNSGQWTAMGGGSILCGSFNALGEPSGSFSGLTSTPLKGFVFFQPPSNTNDIRITGNAGFAISGTFYSPRALVDVGGNGSMVNGASQFVSRMMKAHGNGNIMINYSGGNTAKTRLLTLIE